MKKKNEPSLKAKLWAMAAKRYPEYIYAREFEKFAEAEGHNASNGRRRTQELVKSGILERKPNERLAWYRYKPPEEIRAPRAPHKQVPELFPMHSRGY